MKIFGFTLIRNGVKYDYSFRESIKSMLGVASEAYVAVGESGDGTEEAVAQIPKVNIIPTVWDENLKEGGLILSEQTNVALKALKEAKSFEEDAWGFYLQGDEVIHEDEYELIKEDIRKANEQGCDCIRFRYLHFWQTHHDIAINKKWYPQEIRAVKLNTAIESWGDAQSFRNFKKPYQSEARIFHYGHVRADECYKQKKHDFLYLYHSEEKMPKYRKREKRFDNMTETLSWFGSHPEIMKERIERLGDIWRLPQREKLLIVGDKENFDQSLIQRINVKKIQWANCGKAEFKKEETVIWDPNFFQKVLYRTKIPDKMRSKLALPWSDNFKLEMKLYEKGFGLK